MFDKYQEHLDHSAPCSSRFDGFDRGDENQQRDQGSRVIGRMTSSRGQVKIVESWCEYDVAFDVFVDGKRVHSAEDRSEAITVARWWMAGCPV